MTVIPKKAKHNILKQRRESNLIKLIPAKRVEDAELYLKLIHENTKGYISLGTKDKIHYVKEDKVTGSHMTQYSFKYEDIRGKMNQFLDLEDVYISMNSFFMPNRQSKNVFQLNLFWVDLDYYKIDKYKNKTQKEMIEILRNEGMFDGLEPSFFVDSGNGLYIMYLINNIPKQLSKFWAKIEKELVNRFVKYGADTVATDISRILRLPGSKNSKTGRYASIIKNKNIRYEIQEVANALNIPQYNPKIIDKDEVDNKRIKKTKSKKEYKCKKDKAKVIKFNNLRNSNYRRMLDLKELQKLRYSKKMPYREQSCFLYMMANLHYYEDIEKAKKDIKIYNKGFKEPLDNIQIEKDVYKAIEYYKNYLKAIEEYNPKNDGVKYEFLYNRQCMLYTTTKIIEVLNIKPEEMKYMKTLTSEDIKRENKNKNERIRYNNKLKSEGKSTKKNSIELNLKKMKDLLDQGLSLNEIAIRLDISISTAKRYKKQLNKTI